MAKSKSYEQLKEKVLQLRAEGKVGERPTPAERADWAYGTTKIENSAVTRKMAVDAVQKKGDQTKSR